MCFDNNSQKLFLAKILKNSNRQILLIIGALIRSMKFISPEIALYLYESTTRPWMDYCCYVWAGAPSCYLELLDSYKTDYAGLSVLHLLLLLNPHRRNVASLSLFYTGSTSSTSLFSREVYSLLW